MIKKSDFIIYKRAQGETNPSFPPTKPQALTPGIWQKEALDTIGMYGAKEGKFSPVHEQLTLFPLEPSTEVKSLNLDQLEAKVTHGDSFRFYAQDTLRQVRAEVPKPSPIAEVLPPKELKDAVSATQGRLLVDDVTQMKEDQFPGRVQYTEGGLYPAGDRKDPKVVEQHRQAPNYRKMPKKPVHGVGQPTEQGFRDVLDHTGAKDKPVVWTNTRAEAVVYIDGEPYNLRQVKSFENLQLKEGATGQEVEALEEQLKQRLKDMGSIEVALEPTPAPPAKATKTVTIGEDNVKTTQDVMKDLKNAGYQVEYRRIPIVDEASPSPAQVDELRQWTTETQAKHPDANLEYVINCHQGRGRTTTGMVATGIALDGRTKQLELPFGITLGEDAQKRADRIIDENFHMQNLRETVDETKEKAAGYGAKAESLEKSAAKESDAEKKAKLELEAQQARERQKKYDKHATEFTKRYALMQKYSEYIDEFGPKSETPSFHDWMGQTSQAADLEKKWVALNEQLGLSMNVALA